MKISFLKAYYGDCVHIEHEGRHIIIDGGPRCEELSYIVSKIANNHEKIDLLVITHYDEDHILGIYNILSELSANVLLNDLIGEVWFNATKLGCHGNPYNLSVNQARKMSALFLRNDVNWISNVTKGKEFKISDNVWLEVIYGGDIFDSMSENRHLGSVSCDWSTTFKVLESYVDDNVLDKSKSNASSIITVLHTATDKQVLLPGDATPNILFSALQGYIESGNSNRFSLIKLPHHGSYRNLTKEILDIVECKEYVICSNGDKYFLPDKKTLLKISKWGHRSKNDCFFFHFNYFTNLFPKLNISEQDKQTYSFSCDGQRIFEL